ncbi:3-hydroxyacyl-CoA dehydrogenase NAD-binding domain-containing protein [Aegicerativicinus sediminis]
MKRVGIIGAGTMGTGIAQVAATYGYRVKLYDAKASALEHAKDSLRSILARLMEKGKITPSARLDILTNISFVTRLGDLEDSELIIEAIVEDLNVKKGIFTELDNCVSNNCIVASNTSSLSISSIASAFKRPDRCIGIHFFNPAPLMRLVEIIPAVQTSIEVISKAEKIIQSWGKTVVRAKDTPGFIVNRVARPFYGEALRIYDEGIADVPTIDYSLKKLGGFKMGPFELMDFIGNDVNYAVTESVFNAFFCDPRYKPSFTQKRLAEAGFLGRKSGKGYYNYDENAPVKEPIKDKKLNDQIFNRILVMLINEAADAVFWNIASSSDIDLAMIKGVNYPKGLLQWADEVGINWVVEEMDKLFDRYREERYRCSPILRDMLKDNKTFF